MENKRHDQKRVEHNPMISAKETQINGLNDEKEKVEASIYKLEEEFGRGFQSLSIIAIDMGSGAGATAVGAMVGSAFLPPLGTAVGAGVGVGINLLINQPFGDPPKSAVDHVKDGVKNITKGIGDFIGGLGFGW